MPVTLSRNPRETLTQNYKRLGLTARLRGPTGGVERKVADVLAEARGGDRGARRHEPDTDRLKIFPSGPIKNAPPAGEVRVVRNSKGAIIRVIRPEADAASSLKKRNRNPLNDPLNDLSDSDSAGDDVNASNLSRRTVNVIGDDEVRGTDNPVIKQLEEIARKPRPKIRRKQTAVEQAWIEELVSTYGDNYTKMFWDRRLNPLQRTENDIRKRVEKWKAQRREGDAIPEQEGARLVPDDQR